MPFLAACQGASPGGLLSSICRLPRRFNLPCWRGLPGSCCSLRGASCDLRRVRTGKVSSDLKVSRRDCICLGDCLQAVLAVGGGSSMFTAAEAGICTSLLKRHKRLRGMGRHSSTLLGHVANFSVYRPRSRKELLVQALSADSILSPKKC